MMSWLSHEFGMKEIKRIKDRGMYLRDKFVELSRKKKNRKILVSMKAKSDLKGFFQLYRTKAMNGIDFFKKRLLMDSGEEMSHMNKV